MICILECGGNIAAVFATDSCSKQIIVFPCDQVRMDMVTGWMTVLLCSHTPCVLSTWSQIHFAFL